MCTNKIETKTRDDTAIYVKSAHLKRYKKINIDTICENRDSIAKCIYAPFLYFYLYVSCIDSDSTIYINIYLQGYWSDNK